MVKKEHEEMLVRQAVREFYIAFDHGFEGACDFATEDWAHINPYGGWTRGRTAVLAETREAHTTFLKDVTDTIEELSIRFATSDVAIATVISMLSTWISPWDGVTHERARYIRTFVVVKQQDQWLVMQDHNTAISS